MTTMGLTRDLKQIAVAEAARARSPVAVIEQGVVALGLPDGAVIAMLAGVALDAATALLAVTDTRVDEGVSCPECRHALVCSQLSGIRHALTLRDYLCEGGEDLILQAVAGSCQLFEADTGF